MPDTSYTLPAPLLQAIVDYLNGQPAREVRDFLNIIEVACLQQDAQRKAAASAAPLP